MYSGMVSVGCCKFCCLVARYFWRSVASPWSRRHSRRTWTWSPKTHHNALLRERWFQERVLGDQGPTYTRLEALGQRISEKRGDTVGQPPSAEICVPNMPSLKA